MPELSVKFVVVNIIFLAIICSVATSGARGDGNPCPGSNLYKEAMKLAPCLPAAKDPKVNVPPECCSAVLNMLTSNNGPKCMCAVMQSDIAKNTGVKAKDALTIPLRCGISSDVRHSGDKCGAYTVP